MPLCLFSSNWYQESFSGMKTRTYTRRAFLKLPKRFQTRKTILHTIFDTFESKKKKTLFLSFLTLSEFVQKITEKMKRDKKNFQAQELFRRFEKRMPGSF